MYYPFSVSVPGTQIYKQCPNSEVAETQVVRLLREGRSVEVTYLRHPLCSFTPADMATVVFGDRSTFLINQIDAAVKALGSVEPAPQGKVKQRFFKELTEWFTSRVTNPEQAARELMTEFRPYLK